MEPVWSDVCSVADLQPYSGVCVLVAGRQVAIFYFETQGDVYAVANQDPFSGANVLYRGMIGDLGGEPMVASPMYKQHFSLRSGVCLDDATVKIDTYPVRLDQGRVWLAVTP